MPVPYDNCAGLQPGEGPSRGLFRDCENIADKSFAPLLLGHGPARRVAPRAHPARRGRVLRPHHGGLPQVRPRHGLRHGHRGPLQRDGGRQVQKIG